MKRTEVWLCVAASSYCVHQISLSVNGRLPEIHATRHRGTSYEFFPSSFSLSSLIWAHRLLARLKPSLLRGLECLVRESWLMNVHSERKRAMLIPPEHSSCFHCAYAVAKAAVVCCLAQTSCLSLEFQREAPLCLRRSTWSAMLINCLTRYWFNIVQTRCFIPFIFTLRLILIFFYDFNTCKSLKTSTYPSYLYCYYFPHFRIIIKPSKLWNDK